MEIKDAFVQKEDSSLHEFSFFRRKESNISISPIENLNSLYRGE